MRILLITPRTPYPPVGGDRLRTFQLLRYLGERHEVRLLTLGRTRADQAAAGALRSWAADVRVVREPRLRAQVRAAAGLLDPRRLPLQSHYFHSPALTAAVDEVLADGVDVAVGSLIRTAPYLLGRPLPVVIDVQDSISLHYRRAVSSMPWRRRQLYRVELPRVERYERRVAEQASAVTMVSPVDLADLQARVPAARLALAGNGVDAERFRPPGAGEVDQPVPDRIVFVGNLRTVANRDMVTWFAREVLPRLRARRPSTRLHVVGVGASAAIQRLDDGRSVVVTGPVDDPAVQLRRGWLSVCPMRWGAGVQNKVLESMACATPVVATSMAARGLGLDDGDGIRCADGVDGLVDACEALMADREARDVLGRAGRAVAERRFGWDENLAPLGALLDEVVADRSEDAGVRRRAVGR